MARQYHSEGVLRVYRPARRRNRVGVAAVAAGLLVGAAGAFLLARAVTLRHSVLPGVSVAGVDVGGLSRDDARARIAAALGARLERPVTVKVGTRTFSLQPALVYEVDVAATEARAFAAGRKGLWSRLRGVTGVLAPGREVAPVIRLRSDGAAALSARVESMTRPAVAARVAMVGGAPVVRSGRPGVAVDEAALLAELRTAALAGATEVDAHARRVLPDVTTADARDAAARAETVLSAPVELTLAGERLAELSPAELGTLLRFQPYAGNYELVLDQDALVPFLEPLVAPKLSEPVDATFRVAGKHVRIVPSQGGTRLAPTKAAAALLTAALSTGARSAEIPLTKAEASLTTQGAKALGIHERISAFTTDMGVSSANRIANVHLLGDYLDGTIVMPGEVFSFNRVIGPRTPERGFLEGQAIVAGVLVPSIGGGVCQTATTIFNAAFEAGLPILERTNHQWYISHYPMGRDATVSWGGPDLRFRNDLDHAVLIEATYTNETFTVTFYGTGQNRKVVATTSTPTNYTQPTLHFALDPTAPRKSVRLISSSEPGFSVSVHRKVFENGELIREDDFATRYTPQNPIKVFGPGRKLKAGHYFVLPTSA